MADGTKRSYQRLPGSGHRRIVPSWTIVLLFFVIGIFALLLRGRRVQLWLGEEHLLLVEWDGYREYYKRFGYSDIQLLMIRKTADGKITSALLGLLATFFGLLAFAPDTAVGRTILLGIASLFGLLLLANFLSGPTCQCHIRTAVQVDELPSLIRLRHARRALDELRPRVAGAQGQLTPEAIGARMMDIALSAESGTSLVASDDRNAPPQTVL